MNVAPVSRIAVRLWWQATWTAALLATLVDAALLQRKRGYFTGGFLSVDHLRTPAQMAGFALASVVSDAAVIGLLMACTVWACARFGLTRRLAWAAMFVVGLGPILLGDFVGYELVKYLGDAFDLRLMFDLVGHNPQEFVAVASKHVTKLALGFAALAVLTVVGFWFLARWRRGQASIVPRARFLTLMRAPIVIVLGAMLIVVAARQRSEAIDNGLRRKPSGKVLAMAVDTVSDVDRDSYGILGRPADRAPFDSRIHPYAIDVPGNGIDEDGVGGDLPPGPTPAPPQDERQPWQQRPNVVVIVLESFRADLIGAMDAGRPVTPVLNALAARGVSSLEAFSHNGYTAQSRYHIFSGALTPADGAATLVDDFKAQGYETAYFSGQDETFGGPGLGVGFERADVHFDARDDLSHRYTEFTTPGSLGLDFVRVSGQVEKFLATRSRTKPLFLYVNFYDTHFPYHHAGIEPLLNPVVVPQAEIGPAQTDALRSMYRNTAANIDRAIGTLLDRVRAAAGADPGVIVLADHGESLFDEGFLGHGYTLNDVQTRIPLIAANLPLSLEQPIGQADLREAIHAALRTPAPGPPVLRPSDSRSVFQYLGNIERPAQIGFVAVTGRIVYDFRSNLVQAGDGNWRRPDDLDAPARASWLELVRTWERLRLEGKQ